MIYLEYFDLAVALIFALAIILLCISYFQHTEIDSLNLESLSIVVPFRNEADHLPALIAHLRTCFSDGQNFEVLLVNDNSTDLSELNLQELLPDQRFRILTPPTSKSGKKYAVSYGFTNAKYEWILQLDADALPDASLFSNMEKMIPYGSKFVINKIHPIKTNGIVRKFFDLDFLSLHFAGLASAKMGMPLLANAASLIIEKSAYLNTLSDRSDMHIASGDDVFTMFAISKIYGKRSIAVNQLNETMTKVSFPVKFQTLCRQRLRWIAKAPLVPNTWFSFLSLLVLIANLVTMVSFAFMFSGHMEKVSYLTITIILLSEIFFLISSCFALKRKDLIPFILPALFVYPFYLLIISIASMFFKPGWK